MHILATKQIGDELLALFKDVYKQTILIAPFIKVDVVRRFMAIIPKGVEIRCVTRWRADEVAAGVSDLEVYELIKEKGGKVYLLGNLHAKYFRGDDRVALGSSNLTLSALGWTRSCNHELMISCNYTGELQQYEAEIFQKAVCVDDDFYRICQEKIQLFCQANPIEKGAAIDLGLPELDESFNTHEARWYPQSRHPDSLYVAYSCAFDNLSDYAAKAAGLDLAYFQVPAGLNEQSFKAYIGMALLQDPLVQTIDKVVLGEYRFGEMARIIQDYTRLPNHEAKTLWQSLMRWLLYFLPERYTLKTYNYSEILERRQR